MSNPPNGQQATERQEEQHSYLHVMQPVRTLGLLARVRFFFWTETSDPCDIFSGSWLDE